MFVLDRFDGFCFEIKLLLIEAGVQDRPHRANSSRTDEQCSLARALYTLVCVSLAETQDAESRAIPLFGMRPFVHDLGDKLRCTWPDGLGPLDDP